MPDFYSTLPDGISEGGDIVLSAPSYDDDGNATYDLAIASGKTEISQLVYTIVRTQAPDFSLHKDLGGNLEDLIGLPNTRSTGDLGANKIKTALQTSPLLSGYTISVKAVPGDRNTILFIIQVTRGSQDFVVPVTFDLRGGIQYIVKQGD